MARKKTQALTEAEIFFIQEKSKTEGVEEIAKSLNRSIEDIVAHVPEHPVKKEKTQMHRLMGSNTRNGRGGVAIMTPSASEMSDSTRQTRASRLMEECTYKPLGDI